MADKTPEQEPSIEEILASIRQIISDDDEKDSGEETAAEPAPAPEPVAAKPVNPAPEPVEPQEDDVLELTEAEAITPEPEPAPEEPAPIEIDLQDHQPEELSVDDIFAKEEPAMTTASADDSILSDTTRQAAIASMAKLAGNMPINRSSHNVGSVTLEDIVREILNPMLREWMDNNLPPMVERIVQKELEKLARQVLDE